MKVYHGSTLEIPCPDILHGKPGLDFGCGFYVTTYYGQAERWAKRKALRSHSMPVLNVYEMREDKSQFKVLNFSKVNDEWLDFVCACRRGDKIYEGFDIIQGPIADDDVFRCVNFYYKGIWTRERTLQELAFIHPNDQIAFITQDALDLCLAFVEFIKLEQQ